MLVNRPSWYIVSGWTWPKDLSANPISPLRWTTRSVRNLAAELRRGGHAVSHQTVSELLHDMGYSLQANRKTLEGTSHPDRDAQFAHLNAAVQLQPPVISIDTKKKELVGPFRNGGKELRPKGDPERVRMHDFVIPELGRASPYGVYDVAAHEAWVSVGSDHDSAAFAVESIRRWWATTRPVSASRTPTWTPTISGPTPSTASGTTPSYPASGSPRNVMACFVAVPRPGRSRASNSCVVPGPRPSRGIERRFVRSPSGRSPPFPAAAARLVRARGCRTAGGIDG